MDIYGKLLEKDKLSVAVPWVNDVTDSNYLLFRIS
jgi:hypothetical protein